MHGALPTRWGIAALAVPGTPNIPLSAPRAAADGSPVTLGGMRVAFGQQVGPPRAAPQGRRPLPRRSRELLSGGPGLGRDRRRHTRTPHKTAGRRPCFAAQRRAGAAELGHVGCATSQGRRL